MLDGLLTILQTLVGWLLLLIWQMLLRIVDVLERFFDIFAGTEPVLYKGEETYLLNLFFSNRAIVNLFWGMAIIAIILSFGFCIVSVARKVTDVSGTSKHTLGQIVSNFIRSVIVVLLLNICIVAAISVTTVIFDRINFSLENAEVLDLERERSYTDEEFATMARILSTMGNYAANPSAESRYNVNACFNAIRGEMLTLFEAKCFDYDFPVVQTGKHTWQSALAQVAKSANLKEDLQLDTYYPSVQEAVILCFKELKTNIHFKPQETAVLSLSKSSSLSTSKMIFLASTMGAEENEQFRNGSLDDALRRSYINEEKSYLSFDHVNSDFAITKINYLIGLIVTFACILFLGKIILLFIVRLLNLLLLYVVSPLFASSMTLDEGSRFQNWTQSFVMQLVAAYASVVMMRIYLLLVPLIVNSDLDFFQYGEATNQYNIYGQLIFILAGAWAVYKANGLIAGALTGNAAGSLQEADSSLGHVVDSLVGPSSLMRELSRLRHNRDRAKSSQKGNEKANETKQQQKNQYKQSQTNSLPTSRESRKGYSNDDSSINTSGNAGLEQLRQKYDMNLGKDDGGNDPKKRSALLDHAEHSRESGSMSKLRSEMGLDNPNSQDSFNIDALPDLGKLSRGIDGNTGSKGKTGDKGGTGADGRNSTGSTMTDPKRNRNSGNRRTAGPSNNEQMKNNLKTRMNARKNQ